MSAAWSRPQRKPKFNAEKADVDWLIVGLGNPGPRYANTPHNVGFAVVESLMESWRAKRIGKFQGEYGTANTGDHDVALLMPLTYMNLSGESVGPAMKSLGLVPERVLVIHDEADLPYGTLRVKEGGGLAGHNGLKSIAQHLKTNDFIRLRIGVGRPEPGDRRPMAEWILAPFDSVLDTGSLYREACSSVVRILDDGPLAAMNDIHAGQ